MLDIKFVRENPDVVRQNIRNKFQDAKLPLVDEVIALDLRNREIKKEVETLRANHKKASKQYGALRAQGKLEEAEKLRAEDAASEERMTALSAEEKQVEADLKQKMMIIPNIIDPSVPIGKDDSENVEVERFGEPVVPDFEVPYHTDIMESFNGIDLDSARKVAGNGFYYLMGDIARLHSAVISYARDFMINRGFTYCVPPFMIRSDVVTGVMSFAETYGKLLTEKQYQIMDDYYNNDLSLSEIAQNHNITRQAVRDIIKKGEKKLFEYEEKLLFMKRTLNTEKKIEKVLSELTKIQKDYSDKQIANVLETIKKELNCLV